MNRLVFKQTNWNGWCLLTIAFAGLMPAIAQEAMEPVEPVLPALAVTTEEPPARNETASEERIPVAETPVTATLEEGRISIQLDDVPLDTAVKLFINVTGANIIASTTNLTGRVTANLKNAEWKAALQSILDVHNLTLQQKDPKSEVYVITPRPPDAPEPMFIENFVLRYKRPDPLVPGVKELLGAKGKVLHSGQNMLTVMATADVMPNVRRMIEAVDQEIPQVLIEAKFVELNSSAIKNLGINWKTLEGLDVTLSTPTLNYSNETTHRRLNQDAQVTSDAATSGSSFTSTKSFSPSTDLGTGVLSGADALTRTRTTTRSRSHGDYSVQGKNFETFDASSGQITSVPVRDKRETKAFAAILSAPEFAVTLSALQRIGGVDVISNPKLVVASGERATIHVGRKDPEIKAVADTNLEGRLTYQREGWIESGVRLDVQPIVNTADRISVTITPQLSRVIGFQESGDTKVKIPILSTREITSQFILPSGRTVAIGGLTETSDRETVNKIPVLGDLPLIGRYLFSHKSTERTQDETIVFVTLAIADTNTMNEYSGIPEKGTLIRSHMSRETGEAALPPDVELPEADLYRPVPR